MRIGPNGESQMMPAPTEDRIVIASVSLRVNGSTVVTDVPVTGNTRGPLYPHTEPASAKTASFTPISFGTPKIGLWASSEAPQYIVPPRASAAVPGVRARGPMPAV